MNYRLCLRLITVIVLLLVIAVSCAQQSQPVPHEPGAEVPADEPGPELPADEPGSEVPADEPDAILFFTWAEDDFEQDSLMQMVNSFQNTYAITVHLVVER